MINGSQHQILPPPSSGGNISNGPAATSNANNSQNPPQASSTMSRFDSLEQTLEMFVENARHLCVIVSDFPAGGGNSSSSSNVPQSHNSSSNAGGSSSQAVFNQKLQTLVCGLQELDQAKHHFQDVKIPLELFDQFVDAGRNPQLYTKECMERTLNKNKQSNGKIELYKKFRAHLLKELSEEFPKEAMQYRAIREQTGIGGNTSGPYSVNNGSSTIKHEPDTR